MLSFNFNHLTPEKLSSNSWNKAGFKDWLNDKYMPDTDGYISQVEIKKYIIDYIVEECGIQVFRLPRYH